MSETSPERDAFGIARLASQSGTKRRYSYDGGKTWGATPRKARAAATRIRNDDLAIAKLIGQPVTPG